MEDIDIAIIGGGPAGLTAGIYAARARRRTVLFEGGVLGGQIAISGAVENYPGFPDGIEGPDLSLAMHRQAERFGMETRYEPVTALRPDPAGGFVVGTDGGEAHARAVVFTAGAEHNRLGVPGEDALTGRGVSYCATCDAAFFRGQDVVVVGGGDAAVEEALFTTRYADRVYLVHRRDALRAQAVLQERAFAEPKIEMVWDTVVTDIRGEDGVTGVRLHHLPDDAQRELPVTGVFIFIGSTPNTHLLRGLVPLDAGGHALVNEWMETEHPGLFAAGDVRAQAARQIVSSAGDGATAAIRADHFLDGGG